MRLNGVDKTLTREEALRLHREMWADMQKELGDCPSAEDRRIYKKKWVKEHGYMSVISNCFLCEYVVNKPRDRYGVDSCTFCPIDWSPLCVDGFDFCTSMYRFECREGFAVYTNAPISEILALPERGR